MLGIGGGDCFGHLAVASAPPATATDRNNLGMRVDEARADTLLPVVLWVWASAVNLPAGDGTEALRPGECRSTVPSVIPG
jgi:hypothetical protein